MMEDKVLQNLIALYKAKGVPLDSIVNSELFKALPVEKKLSVIKALGKESQEKLKVVNTSDVKKLLLGLGLGAIAALYLKDSYGTFMRGIEFNKVHRAAIAAGSIAASPALPSLTMGTLIAGAGAASAGYLNKSYKDIDHKYQLKNINTSSDNAILHYLSERDRYVSS